MNITHERTHTSIDISDSFDKGGDVNIEIEGGDGDLFASIDINKCQVVEIIDHLKSLLSSI